MSRRRLSVSQLFAVGGVHTALVWLTVTLVCARVVGGTNGAWQNSTSGGLWSDSNNWLNGSIATGTDGLADFSTLDITADNTVHVDTARTIGNLVFGDTNATNNWLLDNNGNAADVLTLAVAMGSPTITVNNQTATLSTALAGTQGLTVVGPGTLVLDGANTFSGATAVIAGTLSLDFTSQNNSKLSTANSLSLSGGTLTITGNPSAFSQSIGGLTLTAEGASAISNSTGSTTLAVGAISRGLGSTVDFAINGGGAVTTTTLNANVVGGSQTILGGWATYSGNTWAVAGTTGVATNVAGLASYSSTPTAGANNDVSNTTATGTITVNSLRFNSSGTSILNVISGNTLTVATGGILVTPNVGSASAQITGGSLAPGSGTELFVDQNNLGREFVIGSTITGSGALVKTGPGKLTLTNTANTYSGGTVVTGGTLKFPAEGSLGPDNNVLVPSVFLNGGTLEWSSQNPLIFEHAIALGAKGGTLIVDPANTFVMQLNRPIVDMPGQHGMLIVGTNPDNGHIDLGGQNTYSGPTILNSRIVAIIKFGGGLSPNSAMTINAGGVLDIQSGFQDGLSSQIASLSGSGTVRFDNRTTTVLIGGNNASTTFSGAILPDLDFPGGGNIVKVGTGTLTLSGHSYYTGSTTIAAGTIAAAGDSSSSMGSLGTSTAPIFLGDTSGSANASLLIAGAYSVANPITVQFGNSGTATIGGSAASSSTFSGSITQYAPVVLSQASGGNVNFTGGLIAFNSSITTIGAGNITISSNPILGSGATLNVNGTGTVTLSSGVTHDYTGSTNINAGTLVVNGVLAAENSIVNVNHGGRLMGDGTILRSVFVNSGGVLSPGNSPGSITLGSLTLDGGAQTNIELGGTTRGSQYDAVLSAGAVSLNGTLAVSLINGFSPATNASTSFDLLDGTLSGKFSALQLPILAAPLGWDISNLYTTGVITATAYVPGDFNRDRRANSADISEMESALTDLSGYEAMHGNLTMGQLVSIGDFNGDSVVNNVDLQGLINLLANGGDPGAGSLTAVPEPSSLALAIMATLTICALRQQVN